MAKDFWDKERTVGTVKRDVRGNEIHIRDCEKNGKKFVLVQNFYPGESDELQPGKAVSIPGHAVEEVIRLLKEAILDART